LKKSIYLGEGQGKRELERAWFDVFQGQMEEEDLQRFLSSPKGQIAYIGQKNDTLVYWVALGKSKRICKQAWVDLWPVLGDCIVSWDMIESE
jgi:hypothetical protein